MRFFIISTLLFFLTLPTLAQTDELAGHGLPLADALKANTTSEAVLHSLQRAADNKKSVLHDYARYKLADLYFTGGNYSAAVVEFQKLVADNNTSILLSKATLNLGKSYLNLRQPGKAIKTFQTLLEKYPEAKEGAEASYLIAKTFDQQGNWRQAYLAYEEVDLCHPLSFFAKKSRAAIVVLKRAHRKQLPRFQASAKALYRQGMAYFNQEDYQMAANIFGRLAREYHNDKHLGEAFLMLGRAEMNTSNWQNAIADLARAGQATPNLAGRASYYLGLAYGRRGDYEKAITAMRNVFDNYANSDLADDAAYWAAYYREQDGDPAGALLDYYRLINKFPYSNSVQPAIWRLGRIYYWEGDFKNAATYLHMAQLYPPGEDTPRCNYFEAKSLEKQGKKGEAVTVYEKLVQRFDHTYYAYRAREQLLKLGSPVSDQSAFVDEEFYEALNNIDEKNQAELVSIMEIWEETKAQEAEAPKELIRLHLAKYKKLMDLGVVDFAADEARYLVNLTTEQERDSAQLKLGEMLLRQGNYKTPLKFADKKIKLAVMSGKTEIIPKLVWQMAYPRAYWRQVKNKAGAYGIDPYLVLAVMREESRFNPKAVSRSGARGLMQIMPRTGKGIAKRLAVPRFRTSKLFQPELNIGMGSWYLSHLITRFDGNYYLSLAGYNGGPNKIGRYIDNWYDGKLNLVDVDEFVESIPGRETRLYVQKVMGSYFEYKRLYDRKRG